MMVDWPIFLKCWWLNY